MANELIKSPADFSLACDRATATAALDFVGADAEAMADTLCNYLEVGQKSRIAYTKGIRYFFAYLNNKGIHHPSSFDLKAYKKSLLDEGKSVSTVNLYIAPVRKLFMFLSSCGRYPNVAVGLRKEKEAKTFKKLPLTASQFGELLDDAKTSSALLDLRDDAIISVLVYTGLRSVSIRELRICDFVKVGNVSMLYYRNKGSVDRDSSIAISAECSATIQRYLAARQETDPKAPLFVSMGHNGGHQLSEYGFRQIANKRLKKHGLKSSKVTCHSFRHGHATALLEAGVPLLEVSRELHHASVTTTQRYLHMTESLDNSPSSRMEVFLNRG